VHMDENRVYPRPALNINLNDSASMWSYAGTVASDDTIVEVPHS
jgi:hypothetical protein